MSEIAHTFGWVERSNERANASLQPFDRALGSFAQRCLQGMEHQLYWVELRRILRQVAQFCAASLDRLLHADDFVEGDVVDDHNVLTLERGDQTLLDVSQEGFSVHGSLDQSNWYRGADARALDPSECMSYFRHSGATAPEASGSQSAFNTLRL